MVQKKPAMRHSFFETLWSDNVLGLKMVDDIKVTAEFEELTG